MRRRIQVVCLCNREREREGETDRQTDTGTDRHRQTQRHTQTHTEAVLLLPKKLLKPPYTRTLAVSL
jgi:hypothetical protein